MSLPLLAVIGELKQTPASIVPILQTLHAENAAISSISKVDLKHLTSRSIGLLNKHEPHSLWCGVNIINVLIDNSVILTSEGSVIFLALLKVWTTPEARNETISRSIVECLDKLCRNIRGKPTLTREVLTPNLGPLFTAYLERLAETPSLIVPSLQTLIIEHPTTSRPFGNKIKAKILEIIALDLFMTFPTTLRSSMCSLLARLTVIEKDGPEKHWAQDLNRIISNIARTLSIYLSILSISEDDDNSRALKELSNLDTTEIFGLLHIDINEPMSFFSISTRVALLLELLKGYLLLRTSFAVVVPIGQIISILDVAFAINTKFVQFKRELRDETAKKYIQITLIRIHQSALDVLTALPDHFSLSLVPHMANVLASLELLIFLQKNRIDSEKVLANEQFMCDIVACTSSYLALTSYIKDFSQVSRIVDLALFLVEPRVVATAKADVSSNSVPRHSKSARKNAKKNGPVVLADLLSHEHLFRKRVPDATRLIVLEFFTNIIRKSPVAPTQYNKIIKFIVIEAVQLKGKSKYGTIPKEVKDVLVAALLHPGSNSASIYSIASSIASSPLLSLVQNPRFPPLPIMVRNNAQDVEEEESEEEYEQPVAKKQKLVNSVTNFEVTEPVVVAQTFDTPDHLLFKEVKVETVKTEVKKEVEEKIEERTEAIEATESVEKPFVVQMEEVLDDESDGGSEIEIPELDMGSNSENEV